MQEINVKIVNKKIRSSSITISNDLSKKFELSMEVRAGMKTAKDENDKSVLLNVELDISSDDEKLKIKFISDIVFELEHHLDDYEEIAEKKLVPMARESLLNSLDEMLVSMGYKKMELAKKM